MKLNKELRTFLKEIKAGQSLSLANFASEVLSKNYINQNELAKLFILGF